MTRIEFLALLERRAAEAEREGSTAPVANVYRLVLEELQQLEPEPSPRVVRSTDRFLTVQEVAQRLGVPARYVYGQASRWPFTRRPSARKVRFSERGFEDWLARTGNAGRHLYTEPHRTSDPVRPLTRRANP